MKMLENIKFIWFFPCYCFTKIRLKNFQRVDLRPSFRTPSYFSLDRRFDVSARTMWQGWVVLEHQELGLLVRPAKRKGLMRWQPMALCDAAAEGRVDGLRLEFWETEKNPWENEHIESTALGEFVGVEKRWWRWWSDHFQFGDLCVI